MPTISFTLSASALLETQTAICALYGYQDEVPGQIGIDAERKPVLGMVPNPESKAQFTRRILVGWISTQVKTHRKAEAAKTASNIDLDIT